MHMTTKLLAEIRRLNQEGKNDRLVAEALGISESTVQRYRSGMGLKPVGLHLRGATLCYTVWDAKTDELLASGTAAECASFMGYKGKDGFLSMVSRAIHGKQKKYHVEKERVNDGAAV